MVGVGQPSRMTKQEHSTPSMTGGGFNESLREIAEHIQPALDFLFDCDVLTDAAGVG
jgi:hypothetical protein